MGDPLQDAMHDYLKKEIPELEVAEDIYNEAKGKYYQAKGKYYQANKAGKNLIKAAKYWNPFDASIRKDLEIKLKQIEKKRKKMTLCFIFLWIMMIVLTFVLVMIL